MDYVRVRMHEVFPNDHAARLRKMFSKEWEGIEQNAQASRTSGGTETAIVDDYDLLSVGHF